MLREVETPHYLFIYHPLLFMFVVSASIHGQGYVYCEKRRRSILSRRPRTAPVAGSYCANAPVRSALPINTFGRRSNPTFTTPFIRALRFPEPSFLPRSANRQYLCTQRSDLLVDSNLIILNLSKQAPSGLFSTLYVVF